MLEETVRAENASEKKNRALEGDHVRAVCIRLRETWRRALKGEEFKAADVRKESSSSMDFKSRC